MLAGTKLQTSRMQSLKGTVQNALFVSPTVNTSTSQGRITLHRASRHRTVIARQGGTGGEPRWRSRTDAADADVVNIARRRLQKGSVLPVAPKEPAGGMDDFVRKLKAAWRIFFPEAAKEITSGDNAKKRLRMILVADRCGVSADYLVSMRESIVKAMQEYVELESEEAVEINLSMDPELGTIYSMAVPVRRVKPTRVLQPLSENVSGILGGYDPTDPDSSPADRFPYGA